MKLTKKAKNGLRNLVIGLIKGSLLITIFYMDYVMAWLLLG